MTITDEMVERHALALIAAEDIAGLIEEVRLLSDHALRHKITTALRALAQENERLSVIRPEIIKQEVAERIRELEAERDSLKIAENHHHEEFARVEAERDLLEDRLKTAGLVNVAIRAETIEECIDALYERLSKIDAMQAEGAIRALAQTDEATARAPPAPQDDPAAGRTPPSAR